MLSTVIEILSTWTLAHYSIPSTVISMCLTLVPLFVSYHSNQLYNQDLIQSKFQYPNFHDSNHSETFDFIIVGGGSAGSVVANRLSKHNTVLLLEAGGDPNPLMLIPAATSYFMNHPSVDWQHRTVPQKHACFGQQNNTVLITRGRVLGGSSSINNMIYMRGNANDYDNWANLTGDSRWTYSNLLPFFKKLENYHGHFPNPKSHSQTGPVHVEQLETAPGLKYWLRAAQDLGYAVSDPNDGGHPQGFSPLDVNTKSGQRCSSYSAYIEPILNRDNLKIYRYARAIKIHLDRKKQAYGLTYMRHGVRKFVRVRKEIIISGGAIESPKLLMLSGIGPKEHLHSVGLESKLNLPVGQNLQDHLNTIIGPFYINESKSFLLDRDSTFAKITEYVKNGTGPLTCSGISGAGFISSSLDNRSWPDIQFLFSGVGTFKGVGAHLEQSFGYKEGFLTEFYKDTRSRDSFSVLLNVARPKSLGEIKLRSRKPFDLLLIDPKYLSAEDDVQVMLEGIQFILKLFENSTGFQQIGAQLSPNPLPQCQPFKFRSEAYWKCYIKYFTGTTYHPSGTCSMGRSFNDSSAVLTSELRVKGSKYLRVIDASVMPRIPNANLNAPSMMIGEVGSDLIREYWTKQYQVCHRYIYYLDSFADEKLCFYAKFA